MTLGDVSTPCKRWLLRPIPPPILWLHSPCRLHKGRHQSHVMAPSRFARLQLASRRGPIKPRSSLSAHSSHWPHVGRCKPHNPAPSPHGNPCSSRPIADYSDITKQFAMPSKPRADNDRRLGFCAAYLHTTL
ncbi:hypothetical protein IG631_13333 [Alternaria alternata]|nr:hypothetical protein IG631_13333 [Alternaria alternata]